MHSWRRLDGIDLLRGAAIFFVLMNHVNMRLRLGHVPYGQTLPHQVLSTLVWSAQYGVQMFFAVSGFLITSTSLRRWGSPAGIRPRGDVDASFSIYSALWLCPTTSSRMADLATDLGIVSAIVA